MRIRIRFFYFDVDPDKSFNFDADLDPTLFYDADPDLARRQCDANLRSLAFIPSTAFFEPPQLQNLDFMRIRI
jgi:hypothetical protein